VVHDTFMLYVGVVTCQHIALILPVSPTLCFTDTFSSVMVSEN